MLKKRVAFSNLGRAYQFPALNEDLAASGGGKAGSRTAGQFDDRSEHRVNAQGAQGSCDSSVDLTVRVAERTERGDRRGDGVGNLVVMPDR